MRHPRTRPVARRASTWPIFLQRLGIGGESTSRVHKLDYRTWLIKGMLRSRIRQFAPLCSTRPMLPGTGSREPSRAASADAPSSDVAELRFLGLQLADRCGCSKRPTALLMAVELVHVLADRHMWLAWPSCPPPASPTWTGTPGPDRRPGSSRVASRPTRIGAGSVSSKSLTSNSRQAFRCRVTAEIGKMRVTASIACATRSPASWRHPRAMTAAAPRERPCRTGPVPSDPRRSARSAAGFGCVWLALID